MKLEKSVKEQFLSGYMQDENDWEAVKKYTLEDFKDWIKTRIGNNPVPPQITMILNEMISNTNPNDWLPTIKKTRDNTAKHFFEIANKKQA